MTTDRLRAWLRIARLSDSFKACFCEKDGTLTKDGERVLRELGKFAGFNRSPLRVSPISRTVDPLASMVSIGRAETVRRIWQLIELDPAKHPNLKDIHDDA